MPEHNHVEFTPATSAATSATSALQKTADDVSDPVIVSSSRGRVVRLSEVLNTYGGDAGRAIQSVIEEMNTQASNPQPPLDTTQLPTPTLPPQLVYPGQPPTLEVPCPPDVSAMGYDNYMDLNQMGTPSPKYWEDSWAGTVWVHRSIELTTSIKMRRYLHLDFLNNLVTLRADVSMVEFGQGIDGCWYCHLRNVRIKPYWDSAVPLGYQTRPIIRINVLPMVGNPDSGAVDGCCIENIYVEPREGDLTPCHDGVHIFDCGGIKTNDQSGSDEPPEISWAISSQFITIRNAFLHKVRRGILIEKATWNAGYDNGNQLENVHLFNCSIGVRFIYPSIGNLDLCCSTRDEICEGSSPSVPWVCPHAIQGSHFNSFFFIRMDTDEPWASFFSNVYGNGNMLDHTALVYRGVLSKLSGEYVIAESREGQSAQATPLSSPWLPTFICASDLTLLPDDDCRRYITLDAPDPGDGFPCFISDRSTNSCDE